MDLPEPYFEYPETFYNSKSAEVVLPLLFAQYKPNSILDVGCGNGSWLQVAAKHGITDIMGIDAQIQEMDKWPLENGAFNLIQLQQSFDLQRKFDMVLCLEVAEHLPPESARTFIESLVRHSDLIVFSAAIPEQEGHQHLHLREPGYWQQLFHEQGFNTYDSVRPQIWHNESVFWWYRQNIFIAQRASAITERPSENIAYLVHPEHYQEKIEKIERLEKERDRLEKIISDWNQRNQSFAFHFKQLIKLIIYGKKMK